MIKSSQQPPTWRLGVFSSNGYRERPTGTDREGKHRVIYQIYQQKWYLLSRLVHQRQTGQGHYTGLRIMDGLKWITREIWRYAGSWQSGTEIKYCNSPTNFSSSPPAPSYEEQGEEMRSPLSLTLTESISITSSPVFPMSRISESDWSHYFISTRSTC